MTMFRIKEIAESKGFNQSTLSFSARRNTTVIHRYWNNQVQRPDMDVLQAIARALGVSITDLFSEEAHKPGPHKTGGK